MLSNIPKRLLYLGGLALLLALLLVARFIAGWGLVTVHVKDAPVGKVIASIAGQGHVRIESSLDPTNTVTMDVDRVTPAQAIDVLANNSESSWRVVYLAAPSASAINSAIATLKGTGRLDDWTTHYYPGPPFGAPGQAVDPRLLAIKTEGPDTDLSKLLDEAAQKSGVMTALPKDWTPAGAALPKENRVDKVIPAMVASVHGVANDFFFLSERRRWGGGPGGGGDGGGDQGPQGGDGGPRAAGQNRGPDGGPGGRPNMNQAWMQERRLAQISQLPPDQQAAAKKEMDEMRAFFDSLKDLTPEERRAKFQDMMANSEMGQRMQDAQLVRQAGQSTQQRISRAVNYIERKAAAKAPKNQ